MGLFGTAGRGAGMEGEGRGRLDGITIPESLPRGR